MISGHGSVSPLMNQIVKKITHSSKPSKIRNTTGDITTTTVQVCGPSTILRIVRVARVPPTQQPMPTLLPLIPWTATPTRNDGFARVKFLLGSG